MTETKEQRREKWREIKALIDATTLQNYTLRAHVYTNGHVGLTGRPECKECWPREPKMLVAVVFQPNEPTYHRGYVNAIIDRRIPDQTIVLANEDMDDLKHYTLAMIDLIKRER